jgi:hypothetical protein
MRSAALGRHHSSMLVIIGATCGGAPTDVTRWTEAGPVIDG